MKRSTPRRCASSRRGWWPLLCFALSACEGEGAPGVDLPIELADGATLIFDRGYVSQHGIPGWNTDQFRGIWVRDVARRGDDIVVLVHESWLASTTYSSTEPGGILLPNPGGGSSATYFLHSTDGGRAWEHFLPADVRTLGGIGSLGWHLMEKSWLFHYLEPGGSFTRLRRYEPGGENPVADAAIDDERLLVPVTATDSWLGGWGAPMMIGDNAYQSVRLESETVFVDFELVDEQINPGAPAPTRDATASEDGATWYGIAPRPLENGACRITAELAPKGPLPAETLCVGELDWSKSLQGENWVYGQRDSRVVGALLAWGPTALFSHKGKVWAYPLRADPPGSGAARFLGDGELWYDDQAGLHPRFDRLAVVVDPQGLRRYYDIDFTDEVAELRFPPNPCLADRPCGGSAELVWASRVTSGQYDLVYEVDRTSPASRDQHPEFYRVRVWPERIPLPDIAPRVALDLGSTPELTPTALELACLAAASCGLRAESGRGLGTYGTMVACTDFFQQLAPQHPRRVAMETAPLLQCPAVLAAWDKRATPVVSASTCPTSCAGSVLTGCDEQGRPIEHDCALEFRACGPGGTGVDQCVPRPCDVEVAYCEGALHRSCWNDAAAGIDCSALGLACDPEADFPTGCMATAPNPEECTFAGGIEPTTDVLVRCLDDRYLTWCTAEGVQRALDCQAHGYTRCEKQFGSYGPDYLFAQGQCK